MLHQKSIGGLKLIGELASAIEEIESRKDELVEFCQQLVRIPSLSGEEKEVAKVIAQKMNDFDYPEVITDGLGSVLGTLKGNKGLSLLYNGHMDHVPAGNLENWSVDPFDAVIKEIRGQRAIIGRGVADMKGAIAAQVFAVGILRQHGITPPGDVHVAAVVHEEDHEGSAMEHIINQLAVRPDIVVLGEATRLNLSIGQRGRCELEVITKGRTSHGSKPERGINAVYHMAKVIDAIERLNIQHMSLHDFLGRASVALIRINCLPGRGNIVPDECQIVLDRRTIPGEREINLIEEINQIIRELKENIPDLDASTHIIEEDLYCYTGRKLLARKYYPAWAMDPYHPLVIKSKETLETLMDSKVQIGRWDFSTDGVFTAGTANIFTIGYGPGDETQAHSPDEHLPIEQLVQATKGYAALAMNLGTS